MKTIQINGVAHKTQRKIFTLLQLAELAFGDDVDPNVDYTGTWYSPATGLGGAIDPDVKVRLADGMIFNVAVTGAA